MPKPGYAAFFTVIMELMNDLLVYLQFSGQSRNKDFEAVDLGDRLNLTMVDKMQELDAGQIAELQLEIGEMPGFWEIRPN